MHTLCVTCQLGREDGGGAGKVAYIDTEGACPASDVGRRPALIHRRWCMLRLWLSCASQLHPPPSLLPLTSLAACHASSRPAAGPSSPRRAEGHPSPPDQRLPCHLPGTFRPEKIMAIAARFGLDGEAVLDNVSSLLPSGRPLPARQAQPWSQPPRQPPAALRLLHPPQNLRVEPTCTAALQ
jgi:hypothetical protein